MRGSGVSNRGDDPGVTLLPDDRAEAVAARP